MGNFRTFLYKKIFLTYSECPKEGQGELLRLSVCPILIAVLSAEPCDRALWAFLRPHLCESALNVHCQLLICKEAIVFYILLYF